MGVGLHGGRTEAGRGSGDPLVVDVEVGSHALQRVDGGGQAILRAAPHAYLAARHQSGDEVAEGLETIALEGGLGAGERLDALDHEAAVDRKSTRLNSSH